MKPQVTFICLLLTNFLFSQSLPSALDLAKSNSQNLKDVLSHYKTSGQHQKYEAAIFLIKNMAIHKSVDIEWEDKNEVHFEFSEFNYPDYTIAYTYLDAIRDSLGLTYKKVTQHDLANISSQLLIQNIDAAFYEWKNNTWSKNYSFETFCEYILPHRNLIESLENWRPNLKELANRISIDENSIDDPVEACTQIINGLEDFTFISKRPDPTPLLSPSQMLFRRQGSCPDLANFAVLVCRSKGVAATFDFTPNYAASSNRHFWNTVIDENGKHIPFNSNSVNSCEDCLPYQYNANKKRLGKVFRITYSIQEQSIANQISQKLIPISLLRQKNIKDVTNEYVDVSNLEIEKHMFKNTTPYINVFNKGKWRTITWGITEENKVVFKELGRDLIYLPSTYDSNAHTYLTYPYLIDKLGKQHELIPDTSKLFDTYLSRDNEYKTNYIDFNTAEINEGEVYRLFYWDLKWKSLGTSIATENGVFFSALPSNALFWLIPEKPDYFERIFMIEPKTNKIIWY